MKKNYNKLVRDNIPDIIEQNGEKPVIEFLNNNDYKKELLNKLKEECNEVISAENQEELLNELADVYEVLNALAHIQNKSMDDVVKIAEQKKLKRGGFEKKIYLKKVVTKNTKIKISIFLVIINILIELYFFKYINAFLFLKFYFVVYYHLLMI